MNSQNKPDNERKKSQREQEVEELVEHRLRMRFDWDNLIEDKIQEGQEKGVFDQLKGKGKPLSLPKNPFGKDKELAHSLLKDNKLTPAWIGSRKTISDQIEKLRSEIQKVWARHEREFRIIKDTAYRDGLIISWDDACQKWERDIQEINKQINDYNLKRPINNLEMIKLDLMRELDRTKARRWLKSHK